MHAWYRPPEPKASPLPAKVTVTADRPGSATIPLSSQTASNKAAARAEFALHLQVLPVGRGPGEVKFLAGTESAAGVWSNDTLPELAAGRLRAIGREAASMPS